MHCKYFSQSFCIIHQMLELFYGFYCEILIGIVSTYFLHVWSVLRGDWLLFTFSYFNKVQQR